MDRLCIYLCEEAIAQVVGWNEVPIEVGSRLATA